MTVIARTKISRRSVVGGTAVATGLALGVNAAGITKALAQKILGAEAAEEIGAWVVVAPNDQVTIRIARSEMGQGTLTGLCQLVAEELECDWKMVKAEYPTPGQNLARTASGVTCRPAAAEVSAPHKTMSGKAARQHVRCSCRRRPISGKYRSRN